MEPPEASTSERKTTITVDYLSLDQILDEGIFVNAFSQQFV